MTGFRLVTFNKKESPIRILYDPFRHKKFRYANICIKGQLSLLEPEQHVEELELICERDSSSIILMDVTQLGKAYPCANENACTVLLEYSDYKFKNDVESKGKKV
jgi:hypothetical protein